jgi:hypothetical protein
MVTRSSLSSSGTLVGGIVPMALANGYFTDGSAEYLRTGLLKAYNPKYATLIGRAPANGYIDLTTAATLNSFLVRNLRPTLYFDGTHFVSVGAGNIAYATTLSSLTGSALIAVPFVTLSGGGTDVRGSCQVGTSGGVLVFGQPTTGQHGIYFKAPGAAVLTSCTGVTDKIIVSVASNPTGTLLVAIDSANAIYTSTNGTAWTARGTMTGGHTMATTNANGYVQIHWSPCANAFLFVGRNPGLQGTAINRTTDGFTMTGVLNDTASYFNGWVTSSPTITLVSCENGVLRRTMDGTTWTTVDLRDSLSNFAFSIPGPSLSINYDGVNNRFYARGRVSADGVTWTQGLILRDPVTFLDTSRFIHDLCTLNGKVYSFVTSSSNTVESILEHPAGTLLRTTPDWVGATAMTFATGSSLNTFMRIA